jgi:hypothetical protein
MWQRPTADFMASPLEQAGAIKEPSEYAALSMDRAITGLWTQRSPLRDADVPYLYGKFYGASRFDSLIDGLNREVTAKLTYGRRPGSSVYNANTFPGINSFYSYKRIVNGAEVVRVLADGTDGVIYDATAGQKSTVFSKGAGAGKARFQGINTELYFSDGVENEVWLQPGLWAAQTSPATTQYEVGTTVIDANGKIEYLSSVKVGTLTSVQIVANVALLTFSGTNFNLQQGMSFFLAGLGGASFLNGELLIANTIAPSGSNFIVAAKFAHAPYGPTANSGTATTTDVETAATTAGTAPVWSVAVGGTTADGASTWTNFGVPIFTWGAPAAPLLPPAIAVFGPGLLSNWQAFTNYATDQVLMDQNGYIQTADPGGVSGGTLPEFQSPSISVALLSIGGNATSGIPPASIPTDVPIQGITMDGGITWVSSFWLGSFLSIDTYTSPFAYHVWNMEALKGPQPWQANALVVFVSNTGGDVCVDANGNLQMVTNTSGGTPTTGSSVPSWNTAVGGTTSDNNLTWTNLGPYAPIVFQGRKYGYAYHCIDGSVSTLSPLSPSSNTVGYGVQLTVVGSGDPKCDSIWIFGTADGQATPLFLFSVPNGGAGFVTNVNDVYNDSVLNPFIPGPQNEANNPPPVGMTAPLYHLGRMWAIYKNTVIVSGGPDILVGNGNTAFAPLSSFPIPEQPIRLFSTMTSAGPGLLIWGRANRYIILGQGTPNSPFQQAALYAVGGGILSYDAVVQRGSTFYAFGGTARIGGNLVGKVFSFDPGAGEIDLGFPIGDQFANVTTGAGGRNALALNIKAASYNHVTQRVALVFYDPVPWWLQVGTKITISISDAAFNTSSPQTVTIVSPGSPNILAYTDNLGGANIPAFGNEAVSGTVQPSGLNGYLYNPASTYVTYAELGSDDTGLYISDGSVGWFRSSPIASPESGFLWSPRAAIVGGTSAVQAVETQSGVTQLLIGPASSGPILFRDSTVNTDNGSAYASYDVKGCIQLCLSGEVGELAHVHVISAAVGARPSVGLLFGEILATTAAPFSWYDRTCSEPPNLAPSQSVYSDRYTMLSKGVTPKCLFFQLGMDYGTQNFPDETLMFTVYGAKYAERRQQ